MTRERELAMARAITDMEVEALRALLAQEAGAPHLAALLGDSGMSGYQRLAEAALSVAALRRFSPKYTSADILSYVASVRLRRLPDGSDYDINPQAAENVLKYAVGQHLPRTHDPVERFRAVVALLSALVEDEASGEALLDALLAEARQVADRWLAKIE